ncbi:MAG: AAA family ATPase [bacterium]|nr:AAA family ATPase [bacterium]
MIIKKLKINGFRNLKDFEVSFSSTGNLIYGMNGAGKTSILEAVFLLAFGKSFLNRKKAELVNDQGDRFFLRIETQNPAGLNQVTAHYKDRFSLQLNQKKSNIFEVNHYLYPVFFSSSDYNLYIESRPHTRKMIDRFIFGLDSLYIRYLLSYNKGLKQKNYLLKTSRDKSGLSSWNKIISELSGKLVAIKMKFIHRLNLEIKNKFDKRLEIVYKPSLDIEEGVSETNFFKQLEALRQKEIMVNRSLKGPHLDRYDIRLNSKNLNLYSSGEKKIHLLMVYISFIELFKSLKKEYPVFLVDDFDTAIDAGNIDFLIEHYPEMQVIATSVNANASFDRLIRLKKEN